MKKMESIYQPYIDPDFETLIERIYPPRVCIDNDTYKDCTLVKVDSANKHGILLEMVQVLTDLDLVISKSYISSDGGWFMDVFHVTDQLGNKITDESLIRYIQQELCASRRGISKELQTGLRREVRPYHVSTEHTALEMTGTDRPGLMSEITAALYALGCHITVAVAWTHNAHVACIMHVEDGSKGGPITDPTTLAHVEEQLELVVETNHAKREKRRVRLIAPAPCQTHTERRLHQLMYGERDYERCRNCEHDGCGGSDDKYGKKCDRVQVSIESCKEKDYSIVNVRSRDRPKLLFDTVCALTDMQYVVFHAVVGSKGFLADQEYFIRQKDGCTLDTQCERLKLSQCLIAAIERRVPRGLRLDVCAPNRKGLLEDITRVFRENSLSITRVEIGTHGGRTTGSFYVIDSSGHDPNRNVVEMVRKEVGEGTILVVNKRSPDKVASHNRTSSLDAKNGSSNNTNGTAAEERPRFSLGSLLWSRLERISANFGSIKS